MIFNKSASLENSVCKLVCLYNSKTEIVDAQIIVIKSWFLFSDMFFPYIPLYVSIVTGVHSECSRYDPQMSSLYASQTTINI